jgi:hypothetical protein
MIFLDRLIYSESLEIIISEGFVSGKAHSIQIEQSIIEGLLPVNTNQNSRQFKIEFDIKDVINFQLIDESFTSKDDDEKGDVRGFLQIIHNSKYLNYVEESHGWYKEVLKKEAHHFRIWTEDDVIDVVSLQEPIITQMRNRRL